MHRPTLQAPARPAARRAPRRSAAYACACAVALVAFATGLTGCNYVSEMSVDKQLFNQNMIACTDAINRGDLQQAEVHLSAARPLAHTSHEQMQLRSLTALIAGAEALREGNGQLASVHFSQIEDPYLRREVRTKARMVDLDVSYSPAPMN